MSHAERTVLIVLIREHSCLLYLPYRLRTHKLTKNRLGRRCSVFFQNCKKIIQEFSPIRFCKLQFRQHIDQQYNIICYFVEVDAGYVRISIYQLANTLVNRITLETNIHYYPIVGYSVTQVLKSEKDIAKEAKPSQSYLLRVQVAHETGRHQTNLADNRHRTRLLPARLIRQALLAITID